LWPIDIQVIHAVESSPPAETEAIEWFLLTTVNITCPEDAVQCLRWYCLRWRIEDWHRVLKSGCAVERIAHDTAERIRRAVAINLVIAWRIMLMTLLGREAPELPPEVLFSDIELQVLRAWSKKTPENADDPGRSRTPGRAARRIPGARPGSSPGAPVDVARLFATPDDV